MKIVVDSREDKVTCGDCGRVFVNTRGLATHIRHSHEYDVPYYYETFEPVFCVVCGEKVPYKDKYRQYKFCSKNCLKQQFSEFPPINPGSWEKKYSEETLLQILRDIHKKYGGIVTQQLVRLDGTVPFQAYHKYFGSFTGACKRAGVPHFKRISLQRDAPEDCWFTYLIDTREQVPYNFPESERVKLDVGDYLLKEFQTGVVIERKSFTDLRGSLTGGQKRFQRMFDRARSDGLYVVVFVDGSMNDFLADYTFSGMRPHQVIGVLKRFHARNADVCQFLFTGGREESASLVFPVCLLEPDYVRGVDLQELVDDGSLFPEHMKERFMKELARKGGQDD